MIETKELHLNEDERAVQRQALEYYVSDLRAEIVRTEKQDWRLALHAEEETLKRIIARI